MNPAPSAQPDPEAVRLSRIAKGDEEAMTTFDTCWFPRFYRRALRFVGNHHEAEDLAHDAICRVLIGAGRFRSNGGAGQGERWIWTVLRNLILDRLRRKGPLLTSQMDDDDDETGGFEPASRGPTAQEELEATEKADAVRDVLASLPEAERAVLVLRFDYDMRPEAIARELKIPVSRVNGRLFRARQRLGEELKTKWPSLFQPRRE